MAAMKSAPARMPGAPGIVCGAEWPYSRASRTPAHGSGLTGGMKRFFPAVEAP